MVSNGQEQLVPCEGQIAPCEGHIVPCEGQIAPCEGQIAPCEGVTNYLMSGSNAWAIVSRPSDHY